MNQHADEIERLITDAAKRKQLHELEVADLRAERDAALADAKRYRWLRDTSLHLGRLWGGETEADLGIIHKWLPVTNDSWADPRLNSDLAPDVAAKCKAYNDARLDAAIDAAIKDSK